MASMSVACWMAAGWGSVAGLTATRSATMAEATLISRVRSVSPPLGNGICRASNRSFSVTRLINVNSAMLLATLAVAHRGRRDRGHVGAARGHVRRAQGAVVAALARLHFVGGRFPHGLQVQQPLHVDGARLFIRHDLALTPGADRVMEHYIRFCHCS